MMEEDFHKRDTIPGFDGSPLPDSKEETPQTIGPYRVESLLVKGGMSTLYLGTHPETKEPVAIKVLSEKFLKYPEVVERFLNEAEIISMANHPNVVTLFGQGTWEKGLYIAMEFIEGVSLRQYLQTTPLSLKKSLEMILEIAYALCHLHTHGIIHRDLKLENILVNEAGDIKVIDFGIAQLLEERDEKNLITKQRIIGTPIYMSPEQRRNPESVSYPSDIYSLGIVAYELVLGKLSHGRIHLSLMPKGLQKILGKCLLPEPEERYQDLVDFIRDLSDYMNSATMKKEETESPQLTELSEKLESARNALTTRSLPDWEGMELSISSYKGSRNVSSPYYDFFRLESSEVGATLATAIDPGADGVVYTAVLHGMLKALAKSKRTKETLLEELSSLLSQDPLEEAFDLVSILISSEEENIQFLSKKRGVLFQIHKDGSTKCHRESHPQISFLTGDLFILTSFPITESEKSERSVPSVHPRIQETTFKKWVTDCQSLSLDLLTETLQRQIKNHDPSKSPALCFSFLVIRVK